MQQKHPMTQFHTIHLHQTTGLLPLVCTAALIAGFAGSASATFVDTFTRVDGTVLGTTEDPSHATWLPGVNQSMDQPVQILNNQLYLPYQTQTRPWPSPGSYWTATRLPGTTLGGVSVADFNLTFTTAWVPMPEELRLGDEWQRLAVNYRGAQPNSYYGGDDWNNNGGYTFMIATDPANPWRVILKDPAGNNIVLMSQGALGALGVNVDWTQPQQVRLSADGGRHEAWIDGVLVYDIVDGSNLGSGCMTWSQYLGGVHRGQRHPFIGSRAGKSSGCGIGRASFCQHRVRSPQAP